MSLANPDEVLPCASCGENDFLPSLCSHCQNYFCSKHLLDHPPCNKTTNRVLTDEERENMRQGISLESLFDKTMSEQRKQLQFQAQQQAAATNKKTTATSSNSTNITPQSVGSSLPPGFHRYKRLEINTSNIPSVFPNSTCVVYFCFRSSIPQEQQSAAAAARRDRENDDDNNIQDVTITRPLWVDTSSTSSVGALLENLAKKLSSGQNSHLYFPSSNYSSSSGNNNNNGNNTFWEKEKLQWRSALPASESGGTFSAFQTISHERNFFELLNKFEDDANSSHKIFSLHQSDPSKPMTSGCRVDDEKTESFRSAIIGTGARVLFVVLSSSTDITANDDDDKFLKSFISTSMNNLWRKHSMCMLPFEKVKVKEDETPKEAENKGNADAAEQQKTDGNNDDDDDDAKRSAASDNDSGPSLSSIPWAPGVSRTSPVVIGVNQNNTIGSGAATPLNNILLTVAFVFDSSGSKIHPGTFGYTCKINTSWITGKVIDEILNQNSNPSSASCFSGNKKNPVIALPPATFPSKTTKSLKLIKLSTGEVLDENSQIGKYFSNATTAAPDGIGILPCDAGNKQIIVIPNSIVAEVKEYGVLVQSRKMPKPLMIRSMKDCVIQ